MRKHDDLLTEIIIFESKFHWDIPEEDVRNQRGRQRRHDLCLGHECRKRKTLRHLARGHRAAREGEKAGTRRNRVSWLHLKSSIGIGNK